MSQPRIVVLICADQEWRAVLARFSEASVEPTPFGECFQAELPGDASQRQALFFHGGWGKIAAAASTQYAIDRWAPDLLVNLGACGGLEGEIERGLGGLLPLQPTRLTRKPNWSLKSGQVFRIGFLREIC